MAARTRDILSLYKQLLKESEKFSSYMYRTYALRRIKDGFQEHKAETDAQKIDDLLIYARSNLEIIKRQVSIFPISQLCIEDSDSMILISFFSFLHLAMCALLLYNFPVNIDRILMAYIMITFVLPLDKVVIGQMFKGQDELIERYTQSKKSAHGA